MDLKDDEIEVKQGQRRFFDEDWCVEVGVDVNVSISFFQDNHFYSEILLNVKDGVKVIRYNWKGPCMYIKFKSSIKDIKYKINTLTKENITISMLDLLLFVYRTGLNREAIDIYDSNGHIFDRTFGKS